MLSYAPIYADENNNPPAVSVAHADETSEINTYVVSQSELTGTLLEGKSVIIKDEEVYIDGERSTRALLVFIATMLAGYFVDGVLIYYTSYTGAELCYQGLLALDNISNRYGAKQAYFSSASSTNVSSFIDSTGATCVPRGSAYACSF